MDKEILLKSMNKEQLEAITTTEGPLLVFAGAGSGKTRVLTYRIAYLIENKSVAPESILAITFTNKAAKEMKERTETLIGSSISDMWIMTFHSMCARILRKFAYLLDYKSNFTIYDPDDCKSLIKTITEEADKHSSPAAKDILNFISSNKNAGNKPEDIIPIGPVMETQKKYYELYEKKMKENNALDFDDLLLKTLELFKKHDDVLSFYQDKFRYIMVDEYQDTNAVQFQLVSLLSEKYKNICVVGDDDQSIYSFRGADIHNILNFEKCFPECKTIKLEQNYRSTKTILGAANSLIKHNHERVDKSMRTNNKTGNIIYYTEYDSPKTEADSVVRDIYNGVYDFPDIAVLYRTNAQSRLIEEACMKYHVPYQIIGGLSFYQRKEIKDLLSYLKVIVNPNDSIALKRIINVPKRGIGKTSVDKIENYANENSLLSYDALFQISDVPGINAATKKKIFEFLNFIEQEKSLLYENGFLEKDVESDYDYSVSDYLMNIIDHGYKDELIKNLSSEEADSKLENINELVNKIKEFEDSSDNPKVIKLLEDIALVSDSAIESEEGKITLMTLHSSKGLEFEKVYMIGMEEKVFPSLASFINHEVEEERRLCYVGITRAKESLSLSSSKEKIICGKYEEMNRSRFINEINSKYIYKDFY